MKKLLFSTLMTGLFGLGIQAQSPSPYCTNSARFTETPVFTVSSTSSQIKVDSNVKFAKAPNWLGVMDTLRLNIVYPKISIDPLPKRPLILMMFGGGFVAGNRQNMDSICLNFAKRGYIAATIDYRLGKDQSLPCTDTLTGAPDSLSHEEAVYRAVQDAHAALRFLVSKQATYAIDTAWIFVGGESAGAGIANALVYNSQAENNLLYPSIVTKLGSLSTSGNTLTTTFTIKGIFNNWGGVSSDFYDNSEAVPMVAFHGLKDGVVPIFKGYQNAVCSTPSYSVYGSAWLYNRLTTMTHPKCADLTVDPNGNHGVYQNGVGIQFRIGRAACFFKSLFCNSCTNYSATTVVLANCSSSPKPALATGIDAQNLSSGISVYPNPFSNKINITNLSNETCQLSNSLGKVIYSGSNITGQDFSALPAGIYFIRISDPLTNRTFKLIKE